VRELSCSGWRARGRRAVILAVAGKAVREVKTLQDIHERMATVT